MIGTANVQPDPPAVGRLFVCLACGQTRAADTTTGPLPRTCDGCLGPELAAERRAARQKNRDGVRRRRAERDGIDEVLADRQRLRVDVATMRRERDEARRELDVLRRDGRRGGQAPHPLIEKVAADPPPLAAQTLLLEAASPRAALAIAVRRLGEAEGLTETRAAIDVVRGVAQLWHRGLPENVYRQAHDPADRAIRDADAA
jgi:hypothetical protein